MSGKIAIISDCFYGDDAITGQPFSGRLGQKARMLVRSLGMDPDRVVWDTVIRRKPPFGAFLDWCVGKRQAGDLPYGPIAPSKYLPLHLYHEHIPPLFDRLEAQGVAVVVPMGQAATWAFLGDGRVTKLRGFLQETARFRVLPTYSMAMVQRKFEWQNILAADLLKAWKELDAPSSEAPPRLLHIAETVEDLPTIIREVSALPLVALDIETERHTQITCISFGGPDASWVIPFRSRENSTGSYWPDALSERFAWEAVKELCDTPQPKVGQNGLYDLFFLYFLMGFRVRNYQHDSMLLHHSNQPEMQKSLDFLVSIYLNAPAWKDLRKQAKEKEA